MMPGYDASFEEQVRSQTERLRCRGLRTIELQTIEKRMGWWEARGGVPRGRTASPREAFEALFFDYMGLAPDELPIVSESDDQIVWESRNRCPTLDACLRLQLDTRTVCRAAYEKSTQAFVSRLDPRLRFLRDYALIRPYADHCRERIVRVDFEDRMRLAVAEARQSRREGNKGYGAVAVLGERLLARGHDTAVVENDPSLHAGMSVLREAARVLGTGNLSGVVLLSTCEPCPMCAAMAVWANVSAIVFGASTAETAARGKSRILVTAQEIVSKSPVTIEVIAGVLHEECVSLYL